MAQNSRLSSTVQNTRRSGETLFSLLNKRRVLKESEGAGCGCVGRGLFTLLPTVKFNPNEDFNFARSFSKRLFITSSTSCLAGQQ